MANVLIVGLDGLSKKIISCVKKADYKATGFDFDVDKITSYFKQDLIINNSDTILNDLLKRADVIILNTDFAKYSSIFRLLPFIKNDCLILDTRIYKENVATIRKSLGVRGDNFIPCNFTLFPDKVIMNYDNNTKMNIILAASNFFQNLKIKTSVLSPAENDRIFANLYQIPYLLNQILFKEGNFYFISNNTGLINYSFFFEDILLNRKNVTEGILNFLDNIPNAKDSSSILSLLNEDSNYLKSKGDYESNITEEILLKIIFEKIFIKTYISRSVEYYIDLKLLNFDCTKYSINAVKEYFSKNRGIFEISLVISKEKLISISSFLQIENLPLNKFMKFLNNI